MDSLVFRLSPLWIVDHNLWELSKARVESTSKLSPLKDRKMEAFIYALHPTLVDGCSRDINTPSLPDWVGSWALEKVLSRVYTGSVCRTITTAAAEMTGRFGRWGPRYKSIAIGNYLT